MAYDEALGDRVRSALTDYDVVEKKMFGGLAFMLHGNMACGVIDQDLVVRLGKDGAAQALTDPHVRDMDFTGRKIKIMVYVSSDGLATPEDLSSWVQRGIEFTSSLPPK